MHVIRLSLSDSINVRVVGALSGTYGSWVLRSLGSRISSVF